MLWTGWCEHVSKKLLSRLKSWEMMKDWNDGDMTIKPRRDRRWMLEELKMQYAVLMDLEADPMTKLSTDTVHL